MRYSRALNYARRPTLPGFWESGAILVQTTASSAVGMGSMPSQLPTMKELLHNKPSAGFSAPSVAYSVGDGSVYGPGDSTEPKIDGSIKIRGGVVHLKATVVCKEGSNQWITFQQKVETDGEPTAASTLKVSDPENGMRNLQRHVDISSETDKPDHANVKRRILLKDSPNVGYSTIMQAEGPISDDFVVGVDTHGGRTPASETKGEVLHVSAEGENVWITADMEQKVNKFTTRRFGTNVLDVKTNAGKLNRKETEEKLDQKLDDDMQKYTF